MARLQGGLPQPLLRLPALPAGNPRCAENDNQRHSNEGFNQCKAIFFFHGGSLSPGEKFVEEQKAGLRGVTQGKKRIAAGYIKPGSCAEKAICRQKKPAR
jgi:hypothetical protein